MPEIKPAIPEGLEEDLKHCASFRYQDEDEVEERTANLYGPFEVRIELRPHLVVVEFSSKPEGGGMDEETKIDVPLDAVISIETNRHDKTEGRMVPVSCWRRHPSKGLIRFIPQEPRL